MDQLISLIGVTYKSQLTSLMRPLHALEIHFFLFGSFLCGQNESWNIELDGKAKTNKIDNRNVLILWKCLSIFRNFKTIFQLY